MVYHCTQLVISTDCCGYINLSLLSIPSNPSIYLFTDSLHAIMIGSFKLVLRSVKITLINYPINETCDHYMGSEMQGKAAYIRLKVVRPFPGLCTSGSYMHQTALLNEDLSIAYFSNPYTAGS
jgi:hypothetical protein